VPYGQIQTWRGAGLRARATRHRPGAPAPAPARW